MPTLRTSAQRVLLLIALATVTTGCATRSPPAPPPVAPARLPPPPAQLMDPPNCGKCSEAVRRLFEIWQKQLTKTQPS